MSKRTKKGEQREYNVRFSIRGSAYLSVVATSQEEAEEAAWTAYHSGSQLLNLEWETDDAHAEEA
jgi:hypothetical protein